MRSLTRHVIDEKNMDGEMVPVTIAIADSWESQQQSGPADDQVAVQDVGSHESAWLDSSTGAICRRLFPRGLNILWGDAEQYWTWRTFDSSTNSNEVAVLKAVCWMDLRGRIKGALTPGTVYTLSWRLGFAPFTTGLNEHPVRFFLDTSDGQHHVMDAYLNSRLELEGAGPSSRVKILRGEDGWYEYEVADFSVPAAAHGQDEHEVAFGMWEHTGNWKCGLYVESVVLRPRQALSSCTGSSGPSLPAGAWRWQVVEAVYAAEQGEKEEAVAKLHRMELLFRKTGYVAAEITATGCRGLLQASMNNPGARQLLMRSVYLAQEHKQQEQEQEEVAASVADKCALMLSGVVVDEGYEEAVGWFRLQRAPKMSVPRFRVSVVTTILATHGRGRRLWGLLIQKAHLQVREAAREIMMMSTSIMDDGNHWPIWDVLFAYERVAEAAVKRQQLSRGLDILREALALGSSSSSIGPFLSIGVHIGWHLWAQTHEEVIRYRMGRLLVKLKPGDKMNLAEALAMFATSLQCALRDYTCRASAADEECQLMRVNAAWWARLLIQVLKGCPPQHFAEAAKCSVLEELVGPGWSPISRSQELTECFVEPVEVLVVVPHWRAVVMGHMEAVRARLEFMHHVAPESSGRSGGSGAESDAWLLFRCTHALATACSRAGEHRTAARHFMRCQDLALKQLHAAHALVSVGEVEAAVSRVREVLSLIAPADKTLGFLVPEPASNSEIMSMLSKMHASLLAFAGVLLHHCGHRDAAIVPFSQAWDVLTTSGCSLDADLITSNHGQQPRHRSTLSEDEMSNHGQQQPRIRMGSAELENEMIEQGLSVLLEHMVRSGEEAAAALELDAALDWYHKAADVARVFPPKQEVNMPMSHLSYRIGELQFRDGAWKESLEMLSNSLRHALLTVSVTDMSLEHIVVTKVRASATSGHVSKACRLLLHLFDGSASAQVGDGAQVVPRWVMKTSGVVMEPTWVMRAKYVYADMDGIPLSQLQVTLGQALCKLSKPEGIRWLEAVRASALLQMGMHMDGASGRTVGLAGEDFEIIPGLNLYELQSYLAWAYSEVADDGIKAAQLYEVCKDMATRLPNRLSMQLRAAQEWVHAGELLWAQEAVLEALDFLVPEPASNSEIMSMLWGSDADSMLEERAYLLAMAATSLFYDIMFNKLYTWPHAPIYAKLKAALEALWELYRLPAANSLDKDTRIALGLLLLVMVYQRPWEEEWVAAEGMLKALEPRFKDHEDTSTRIRFQLLNAQAVTHTRRYLEAAKMRTDVVDSAMALEYVVDIQCYELMLGTAMCYLNAGQHKAAKRLLDRLEPLIQTKTSWPRYDDGFNEKLVFEHKLCVAQARVALRAGRWDQAVIQYHKAHSLLRPIINDLLQHAPQQLPVPKDHEHRSALVSVYMDDAELHARLYGASVDGLEGRIAWIEAVGAGAECGLLRADLLFRKRDLVGAAERARVEFLRTAERQEGKRGDDDDNWITEYDNGLGRMVDLLQAVHLIMQQPLKALLWAERGRMRLFMHRVHAQQQQLQDDPEPAIDSSASSSSTMANYDFDRDDDKGMDMLLKALLACGPNVALIEYSFWQMYGHEETLHIYGMFADADPTVPNRSMMVHMMRPVSIRCAGIEQLVMKARDSISATTAAHKKALAKLHSLLVAPVQEWLQKCDTFIFAPQGCLSLVPFAALYDESAGQFLIQQKQVVVAPCLRALYRCLDLQDRFFSTASALQQPLVAGNPWPMGLGEHQLPHAAEEAAAVADILGVEPCLGAAMTKEAVIKGLCGSSVVHLATHAIVSPKFLAGAVVLQGPKTDPDVASSSSSASTRADSNYYPPLLHAMDPDSDEPVSEALSLMRGLLRTMQASVTEKTQVLTPNELSGMCIRAGLVVLSACETGRGEVTPEGLLGLGRALLQAGAATTVLSLWKVDDQATKRLITEMFQELQKGEPVGTALRKAMLKMIQEGSSISHWAPFFIFGSPTMHLRNVTTLKRKKMNPELELGHVFGRMSWSDLKKATFNITSLTS